MHGTQLKYLRNCFTMLEMAYEFDKRVNMFELTYICVKWLKYLNND